MRLLLINKNPVVSRMMQMSVPKAGFDIEECDSIYDLPTGNYEVVVLDDEMYDENFLHDIKQNIKYHQIGIITSSKGADFSNFDFILTKPFLPTDLIEILRKVKNDIENQQEIMPMTEEEPQKEEHLFDSFLKGDASPFGEEERIVEIEEPQEESPFIEEPMEKAGVLKEEEVQEVSELLKEPAEPQEFIGLKEEPLSEITKSVEEKVVEPQEFTGLKEEPLSEVANSLAKEEQVEPKSEEPLVMQEPHTPKSEEEPTLTGLNAITPEALLTDVEEKIVEEEEVVEERSESSLNDLKKELQKLDVKGLREILDGMQLEITIKISYPDRKDV